MICILYNIFASQGFWSTLLPIKLWEVEQKLLSKCPLEEMAEKS